MLSYEIRVDEYFVGVEEWEFLLVFIIWEQWGVAFNQVFEFDFIDVAEQKGLIFVLGYLEGIVI